MYETNGPGVYAGVLLGPKAYEVGYRWFVSTYDGFTLEPAPSTPLSWTIQRLPPPFSPGDFSSLFAGASLQLTSPGVTTTSVSYDTTSYPGFAGYYNPTAFQPTHWAFNVPFTLAAPGGDAGIPAFTRANAIRTPPDFTVTPNLLTARLTVYQDSPIAFSWTPTPADAGTQFVFRIVAGDRVLAYVADDQLGSLTVPAAQLAPLPSGAAILLFERTLPGQFTVAGNPIRGLGQVIQQGYANLVPACAQQEVEPNETPATANALTLGTAQTNMCGTYGVRGDLDNFKFNATAGQVLSLRTYAADLGSALDSLITLTAPDGRAFSNDNASSATKDSALLRTIDLSGQWSVNVTNALSNRVGDPTYFYNLLGRLVLVAGAAVSFPGTQEGATPLSTCFNIPDTNGVFVEGVPAVCNLTVSGLPTSTSKVNLLAAIVHTYPSDVRLTLKHPDGTTVVLVNHTGRISGIFDYDFQPDDKSLTMAAFNGKDPNGTWVLTATDWYKFDVGTINSATLFIAP